MNDFATDWRKINYLIQIPPFQAISVHTGTGKTQARRMFARSGTHRPTAKNLRPYKNRINYSFVQNFVDYFVRNYGR
jgi:hypothetical protein